MTSLADIKWAVALVLMKKYPDIPVYGADTVEGYQRPAIFSYISASVIETTMNCVHKNVDVELYLIQQAADEEMAMEFLSDLQGLFSPVIEVGKRFLCTTDFYAGMAGEHANIPNVQFTIDFWDDIHREEDESVLLEEVNIKQEVE